MLKKQNQIEVEMMTVKVPMELKWQITLSLAWLNQVVTHHSCHYKMQPEKSLLEANKAAELQQSVTLKKPIDNWFLYHTKR